MTETKGRSIFHTISEIGDAYMGLPPDMLDELVANGMLIEVVCDAEEPKEQSNSRRSP